MQVYTWKIIWQYHMTLSLSRSKHPINHLYKVLHRRGHISPTTHNHNHLASSTALHTSWPARTSIVIVNRDATRPNRLGSPLHQHISFLGVGKTRPNLPHPASWKPVFRLKIAGMGLDFAKLCGVGQVAGIQILKPRIPTPYKPKRPKNNKP